MTSSRAARYGFLLAMILTSLAWQTAQAASNRQESVRLYNEACRLSAAGNQDQAIDFLRLAFAAGFDDPRFAMEDPDLVGLVNNSRFQALLGEQLGKWHLLSAERGITLQEGPWSQPADLFSSATSMAPSGQTLALAWQPGGLAFRLELKDEFADWSGDKIPPPWEGGPGLVLSIGVDDMLSAFESRGHFIFAFGLEKSTAIGGMYAERLGWQRVLQLDPDLKLDRNQQTLTMNGLIPWESLRPFGPLSDSRLGINAAVRTPQHDGSMAEAQLLADPAAFQPSRTVRRFVPLDFAQESAATEVLNGRVDSSINHGQAMTLQLSAVVEAAGEGTLAIDFVDNRGQSLLSSGPALSTIQLKNGLNTWDQQADFSRLNMGLYTVRAELELPSQQVLTWSSRVLQLGADWQGEFLERIAALPPAEQPTAHYYLQTVKRALKRLHPRFDPGAIGTTLGDLDRLLIRHAQTGTIVPDQGTMLLVYPGPEGQERLCTLYLPEGFRDRGPLNPVVLLTSAAGFEPRLAMRIARSYEAEGHLTPEKQTTSRSPIYLVPHPVDQRGDILTQTTAEAEAALEWVRMFFAVPAVTLCGVDDLGGPSLVLAAGSQPGLNGLLIMAGGRLNPWPQADDGFLAQRLDGFPGDVPFTWFDFIQESRAQGQGPQLLRVLQEMGHHPDAITEIRGGISLTQVADRLVLWSESLP